MMGLEGIYYLGVSFSFLGVAHLLDVIFLSAFHVHCFNFCVAILMESFLVIDEIILESLACRHTKSHMTCEAKYKKWFEHGGPWASEDLVLTSTD